MQKLLLSNYEYLENILFFFLKTTIFPFPVASLIAFTPVTQYNHRFMH
jgi:hypothetical protein